LSLFPAIKEQVVISGIGCISAAGRDVDEHIQSLNDGTRNCSHVPGWLFETKHNYPVFTCPQNALTESGSEFIRSTGNNRQDIARTTQLMVSATAEALVSAGLFVCNLKEKRLGIAIGTTVGCTFNNEDYYKSYKNGYKPSVKPVLDYLNSNLAYRLHALLGTNGPSIVVTNACASGTDAIGIAGAWIADGHCDIAIAGGADELSRIAYNGFVSLQLTDSSPCRPFDQTRQGLNLGEGSGIVILEKERDACDRGSLVGRLRGYGASSDAWHPTAPHPEGLGLLRAVNHARQAVGVKIYFDTINTHGTATKANDIAETNALSKIISNKKNTAIVSTKGWTGHTLGAAGAIEAIFTLISLNSGVAWGTLGCDTVDPNLQVRVCPQNDHQKLNGKIGLSQSLAFGGCNSALILEGCQ
jgi:3-oxoacyl-(acyl-carrier-protein) synthase